MSADRAEHQQPQASSSHMMKTTKRGRPYLKDTLDLFATLIVSLQLTTHKQYFRTFPNSFSTDEAALNLASLKFSQSNRGPDPRDKTRIVTTTTTTTFSMTREMAKAMCQHFMDARLIENAADQGSNLFKDRGTYVLTPKGLHVLERFISKNGINSDHLQPVFASQPICIKLLHLERRSADDEIIVTQSVITALFRRFVGRQANYPSQTSSAPQDAFQEYHERSKGVPLMDVQEKAQPLLGKATIVHKYCFAAVSALEWLCDFTSVVGREEAAEMAAQFVRFGLITLVSDKRKNNDSAIIFTVRGSAPGGNSPVSQHGEFRCTAKAIYRITDEGKRVAQWDEASASPHSSTTNFHERSSLEGSTIEAGSKSGPESAVSAADAKIHRRISMAEKLNSSYEAKDAKANVKSNTDRLNQILEEPSYRALFRDFLKANFCEENLAFWLDVEDFKRKFNITSSAQANAPAPRSGKATPGQAAMERHHESLIQTAFHIYNKYLAPSSQNELNIDHNLRLDLASYLGEVMTNLNGKSFDGQVDASQAVAFNATQLQTLIKLYSRIQTHVLRLMAMDSLPKFVKTQRFTDAAKWLGEGDSANEDVLFLTSPPAPPGLGGEETGGRVHHCVRESQRARTTRTEAKSPTTQFSQRFMSPSYASFASLRIIPELSLIMNSLPNDASIRAFSNTCFGLAAITLITPICCLFAHFQFIPNPGGYRSYLLHCSNLCYLFGIIQYSFLGSLVMLISLFHKFRPVHHLHHDDLPPPRSHPLAVYNLPNTLLRIPTASCTGTLLINGFPVP